MARERQGVQSVSDSKLNEALQTQPKDCFDLLGLPVSNSGLCLPADLDNARASHQPFLVTFVNPNACYVAAQNPDYPNLLGQFDRVFCDGIGLVWAAKIKAKRRIPRLAFDTTSLAMPVLGWARANEKPVVLVGGKEGVAANAANVLTERLSGLIIDATYSGFGTDLEVAAEHICQNRNCLVVCGMGAPLQEQFLISLRDAGWSGIGFTCGGFMDQICERFHYYPKWVDSLNLRFAYRLLKEPQRLGKRYLRDYGTFAKRFLGWKT